MTRHARHVIRQRMKRDSGCWDGDVGVVGCRVSDGDVPAVVRTCWSRYPTGALKRFRRKPLVFGSDFGDRFGGIAETVRMHAHLVHHAQIQPTHLPIGLAQVVEILAALDLAASRA